MVHDPGDGEAFALVALGWVGVLVYIVMEILNGDENRKSSLDLRFIHVAISASTLFVSKSSQRFTYSVSRRCKSGPQFECKPY